MFKKILGFFYGQARVVCSMNWTVIKYSCKSVAEVKIFKRLPLISYDNIHIKVISSN